MGVPSGWVEPPAPGVGVKCGGGGGVKFCWNLLPAACLVRSGFFLVGGKLHFRESLTWLLFRFPQTAPIVDVPLCSSSELCSNGGLERS